MSLVHSQDNNPLLPTESVVLEAFINSSPGWKWQPLLAWQKLVEPLSESVVLEFPVKASQHFHIGSLDKIFKKCWIWLMLLFTRCRWTHWNVLGCGFESSVKPSQACKFDMPGLVWHAEDSRTTVLGQIWPDYSQSSTKAWQFFLPYKKDSISYK